MKIWLRISFPDGDLAGLLTSESRAVRAPSLVWMLHLSRTFSKWLLFQRQAKKPWLKALWYFLYKWVFPLCSSHSNQSRTGSKSCQSPWTLWGPAGLVPHSPQGNRDPDKGWISVATLPGGFSEPISPCRECAPGECVSCNLLELPFVAGRFWDCFLLTFLRSSHRDLKPSLNPSILENHGPQCFGFLFFGGFFLFFSPRITELRIEPMSAEPWNKIDINGRGNITRSWESPEKFGVYPPITVKLRQDTWAAWTKCLGLLEPRLWLEGWGNSQLLTTVF